jgi:hypothetical protein
LRPATPLVSCCRWSHDPLSRPHCPSRCCDARMLEKQAIACTRGVQWMAERSLLGSGLSSAQLGAPRLLGCPCPDVGSILSSASWTMRLHNFPGTKKYNRRSATMGNKHPTLRKCGGQLTETKLRERRLSLQLFYRKERFAERNATVTGLQKLVDPSMVDGSQAANLSRLWVVGSARGGKQRSDVT